MKTNFHTHNYRCGHAIGTVDDYVKKAIKENYDIIGISDHAPLSKYYNDRMNEEELDLYIDEINECKLIYGDKIKIYSGLEIEYFNEYQCLYKDLLTKLDYLILAPHDFLYKDKRHCSFFIDNDDILRAYFDILIKGIKTNYFAFAAHPDIFAYSYHFSKVASECTHKLAKVCLDYNFILEFNANGFRKGKQHILGEYRYYYPYKPFWDIIKKYNVKVIINSDTHDPNSLNDKYDEFALKTARVLGLNIIDTIF